MEGISFEYSKDKSGFLRFQYLEVRVGDNDISGTEAGSKICSNHLCHTTGKGTEDPKDFQCSWPLLGRFITLQKYRTDNQWTLAINEVFCYW